MKEQTKIDIVGYSRLRIGVDGHGIRTLVLSEGCPLRCKYCINPYTWNGTGKIKSMTKEELFRKLYVDNLYFLTTAGGITFGGGEPLLHADFIFEFVKYIEHRWNICVETSLNVPRKNLELLIGNVDYYIIDIKTLNSEIYKAYTSCRNKQVIGNLEYLLDHVDVEKIRVRVPNIPEYTTAQDVEDTVITLQKMGVENIEIFNYKI